MKDKDDMSNTVDDKTIIRFLNAKMEAKGAGASRGVVSDSNTAGEIEKVKIREMC